MDAERADVVVVGSGPNGLAAAITLAEAGREVMVCEAADTPGGAVRTAELTEPGVRHDVFSAVHPAAAASPVFARWPLTEHGLDWVHPEVAMAHPLPDGSAVGLHRDLDRTAASLDAHASGDGSAWRDFAGPLLEAYPALRRSFLSGWVPVRGPVGLLARLGLGGTLEFARTALAPATVLAEETFASPAARAWLLGSVHHGDVPADEAGSALTGLYLQLLGHAVGWPSPRGGAQGLTDALVSYLRALGGQVRTGARVDRVVSRHGRVAGVGLADGGRVRADVVVADTTPHALADLAGDDALGRRYARAVRRYRYGPGTVKLDWALDAPLPWTAAEVRRAGTVHVGGTPDEIRSAANTVRQGRLPERPFLLAGQQSLADPTRAPEGIHTAWAYTRVPHGIDWPREAEAFVTAMEAQIERFAPGFAQTVRARHVLLPPDLESRNANLAEGDVGNGTLALDQVVFRPVPTLAPYRTPVAGLYLGSAATFPGPAVHGVPGRAAARLALAESRARRW